ncbi:MAG TPA: hypothetical protein VNW90_15705 [Acetobacteraceae bacterium]|jgi:hypothetical protein|nr:hypothetical protein [Acetobacteraceae bacterium]
MSNDKQEADTPTIASLIAYAKAHPVQTDAAVEKRRDEAWRRAERFADMIGGTDG